MGLRDSNVKLKTTQQKLIKQIVAMNNTFLNINNNDRIIALVINVL